MKFMILRPYDGECFQVWDPDGANNGPLESWPDKLTKKLSKVPGFDRAVVVEQYTEIDGMEVIEQVVAIDLAPPAEDDGIYVRFPYKTVDAVNHISQVIDQLARIQLVVD